MTLADGASETSPRRDLIRRFLTARRARLSPEEVGVSAVGRRNTPGLRREEVAWIAGVSPSWYTWLEQGRDIEVSPRVLDGVSAALRLDDDERAYLYRLVGARAPRPARPAPVPSVREVEEITDRWLPLPVYATDRHWTLQALNVVADDLLGGPVPGQNCLRRFFLDPAERSRHRDWSRAGRRLVGQFRAHAARFPDDPVFPALVAELSAGSVDFAALWRSPEVNDPSVAPLELLTPGGAAIQLEQIVLEIRDCPDVRIVVLSPGTEHEAPGYEAGRWAPPE